MQKTITFAALSGVILGLLIWQATGCLDAQAGDSAPSATEMISSGGAAINPTTTDITLGSGLQLFLDDGTACTDPGIAFSSEDSGFSIAGAAQMAMCVADSRVGEFNTNGISVIGAEIEAPGSLTLQDGAFYGHTSTAASGNEMSIVATPGSARTSDLVNFQMVGTDANNTVLNLATNDVGGSFISMHDGSADVLTVSQPGVLTLGATASISQTSTAAAASDTRTFTPGAAFTGDSVSYSCVGTDHNGTCLNVSQSDANGNVFTFGNGTTDLMSLSQTGTFAMGDGTRQTITSTQTTGTELAITATPGSNRSSDIMSITAAGANWTGGYGLSFDVTADASIGALKADLRSVSTHSYLDIYQSGTIAWEAQTQSSGGLLWRLGRDIGSGNAVTFDADSGREITDTNDHQSMFEVQGRVNQTGTASFSGISWSPQAITSEGDGTSGTGNAAYRANWPAGYATGHDGAAGGAYLISNSVNGAAPNYTVGSDGIVTAVTPRGEMTMYEAAQALDIDTAQKYVGAIGFSTGDVQGFTFDAGRIVDANITSEADNTVVRIVTSAAHGLTTGDIVTITGANNAGHDGITAVTVIDATTFDCDDLTYVAGAGASAAVVYEPSYLEAGATSAGEYEIGMNVSMEHASGGAAQVIKWEVNVNATEPDKCVGESNIANAALETVSSSCFQTIAAGDRVWLAIKNQTAAIDMTIQHANVHLKRF
jgi:hypothetical protein